MYVIACSLVASDSLSLLLLTLPTIQSGVRSASKSLLSASCPGAKHCPADPCDPGSEPDSTDVH